MSFYTAPEAQKNLVNRIEDPDQEYAVKVNGNFSYGITPCKDYDEKQKAIKKMKEKAEKDLEEKVKQMPRIQRLMQKFKRTPNVKYEIEMKPRNLNEISQLKDIKLNIKKGQFVIIIGKI